MHIDVDVTKVQEGTWRVLVSLPPPMQWVMHPATFLPGLALVGAGTYAYLVQGGLPAGAERRMAAWGVDTERLGAVMYGRLAAAAWVFLDLSVFATWRFEGLVAEVQQGLDWRFLAHLRTTWLDRALLAFSLAAGVACWILSWGPRPVEAGSRQGQGHQEQEPPEPAA